MNNHGFTRRKFLAAGTAASLGMAAIVVLKVNSGDQVEKALCISREGKLYEVKLKDLEKALHKGHLSNEDLRVWSGKGNQSSSSEL